MRLHRITVPFAIFCTIFPYQTQASLSNERIEWLFGYEDGPRGILDLLSAADLLQWSDLAKHQKGRLQLQRIVGTSIVRLPEVRGELPPEIAKRIEENCLIGVRRLIDEFQNFTYIFHLSRIPSPEVDEFIEEIRDRAMADSWGKIQLTAYYKETGKTPPPPLKSKAPLPMEQPVAPARHWGILHIASLSGVAAAALAAAAWFLLRKKRGG